MEQAFEYFVARDRARQLAWRLERVLQERRLTWRGSEVGMEALSDEAGTLLAGIAADARQSVVDVVEERLRDRECGFMEIPFTAAVTAVAHRIERAAFLEARCHGRGAKAQAARVAVERLLVAALGRLAAFSGAYDLKQPLAASRTVDIRRVVAESEDEADTSDEAPSDPLLIATDRHALEDLLIAACDALPEDAERWRVQASRPGRPLVLWRGTASKDAARLALPPEVERAAAVLRFAHPVEVRAEGRSDGMPPACIALRLGDPAGESLDVVLAAVAGSHARLAATAEQAVRALLAAPPLPPDDDAIPPARLVALLGLLQALDTELPRLLLPRLLTPPVRAAAARLPREATRKAPVRARLLEAIAERYPDLAVHRIGDLASRAASGSLGDRDLTGTDAAVLLTLFGRRWTLAGASGDAVLGLEPLATEDVEAAIRDLVAAGTIRRELEAGRPVAHADVTRLECAAIAVLGRLGRIE